MLRLKTAAAALAATLTFTTAPAQADDIVDIAVANGNFNTLIFAATFAGLADELKGDGPFTVFAPTDDVFAALPEGTIEGLLADRSKLVSILTYHVDDRDLRSSDIGADYIPIRPLNTAERFCISWGGEGQLKVLDGSGATANVVAADIVADNGRIHVIDKVLLPGKTNC